MKVLDEIEIVDLALKYKDTLIIGDLQLGYEEYLRQKGTLLPKFQLKDILSRLDKIFSENKFKRVILNGDIKHEFGRINRQEWDEVLELFNYLEKKVDEIILVKGNHDPVLFPLAERKDIEILDKWNDGNLSVLHGDKILLDLKKNIIIAHEHPAISFKEKPGEKFKCFLVGKYGKNNLIVMPSFTTLNPGTDVSQRKFLSPFLNEKNIENFEFYVVAEDGKPRKFGKLEQFEFS